jgi:hypothetical protein
VPEAAQIKSLTFATASAEDRASTRASWTWKDVAASCVVMVGIIGAYLYFTG